MNIETLLLGIQAMVPKGFTSVSLRTVKEDNSVCFGPFAAILLEFLYDWNDILTFCWSISCLKTSEDKIFKKSRNKLEKPKRCYYPIDWLYYKICSERWQWVFFFFYSTLCGQYNHYEDYNNNSILFLSLKLSCLLLLWKKRTIFKQY